MQGHRGGGSGCRAGSGLSGPASSATGFLLPRPQLFHPLSTTAPFEKYWGEGSTECFGRPPECSGRTFHSGGCSGVFVLHSVEHGVFVLHSVEYRNFVSSACMSGACIGGVLVLGPPQCQTSNIIGTSDHAGQTPGHGRWGQFAACPPFGGVSRPSLEDWATPWAYGHQHCHGRRDYDNALGDDFALASGPGAVPAGVGSSDWGGGAVPQ